MRPTNVTKTVAPNPDGLIKVRVQGKSIVGDNIVTSDEDIEVTNEAKQNAKTEITKAVVAAPNAAPKIDEGQIQNLILTSLQKIVANEATPTPSAKKPIASATAATPNTGTANKTIARRTIPPRTQVRNTGNNPNRQQSMGNRNDGGNNARGNIGSLNRSYSGNGNNNNSMLSDFGGMNRSMNFGNDTGNNMGGGNMRNSSIGDLGLSFSGNVRGGNSNFDNNMMRGSLSNQSDFNSDFSSIGMRRSNMMGSGSNSMGSGGRGGGFDGNSGMGMSGYNSGNMWGNSNNSNGGGGGGGGGGGYNNSCNGNSNRY